MVAPTSPPALTRGDLRWRIANRLGGSEEWAWRTAAGAGATVTTAPLPDLVIGGVNENRGLWVWFADGPNAGQERRVVAFRPWQPADPTAVPPVVEEPPLIEWAPALPAPPAEGDRIDLCVLRPTRLNDAIDDALRLLVEAIALPAEATLVTDGTSDRLALPADAVAVADVAYLDDPSVVVNPLIVGGASPSPADRWLLPRSEWSVQPGRTVQLAPSQAWGPLGWSVGTPAAGQVVLIDYRAAVPLPADDDALVPCLPAAIVDTAVSELALGMPDQRQMLPLYLDQATRSRARAMRHDFGSLRPVIP